MTVTVEVPAEGQEIPSFVRRTGFANWNRFAAVNGLAPGAAGVVLA